MSFEPSTRTVLNLSILSGEPLKDSRPQWHFLFHYLPIQVFVINVRWKDGIVTPIYRSYSTILKLQVRPVQQVFNNYIQVQESKQILSNLYTFLCSLSTHNRNLHSLLHLGCQENLSDPNSKLDLTDKTCTTSFLLFLFPSGQAHEDQGFLFK